MLSTIALQNLKKKKFRSFITSFAIAIGTATLLIFFGLQAGITQASFNEAKRTNTLNQISVRPIIKEQGLASLLKQSNDNFITPEQIQNIKQLPNVKKVHTQNQFNGFASIETNVLGVSFITDSMLFGAEQQFLKQDLNNQDWQNTQEPYPAVISRKILDLYNLTIAAPQNLPTFQEENLLGKKLTLYPNYSSFFPVNNKKDQIQLEVVAFSDRTNLIGVTVPYQLVADLNNKYQTDPPEGFNEIFVETTSENQVTQVAEKIEAMDLTTNYLQKNFQNIQAKFSYLKSSLLIISIIILISTIISISTSFLATLTERKKENHLLQALGASRKQLRKIILIESGIIGITGATIGLILASIAAFYINNIEINISALNEQSLIILSPTLIATVLLSATLLSIISAYLPAITAFKK